MSDAVSLQREHYRKNAEEYESGLRHDDEHAFAYAFLEGMLDFLHIQTVLDVGSGTGRFLRHLKKVRPSLQVMGIEPSSDLRQRGYQAGVSPKELIDGNAQNLQFGDGAFDLVCESGALHHMQHPSKAISEMLRVSKKAIFISDGNNFGQGRGFPRMMKQLINSLGLWPVANYIRTHGKGYMYSPGDGIFYSYSVFTDYPQIRRACKSVHLLNTVDAGINPYRTATHIALLGIK